MLFPALFSIIFNIFYSFLFQPDTKSEWLTNSFVFFSSIFILIINALFLSILSLGIFLNNYPNVRCNRILSFLTWLGLPTFWCTIILLKHFNLYLITDSYILDETLYVLSATLPYIIGLIISLIKFRKDSLDKVV